MHRAEKASSRLCRDREVEMAHELHRRKINDVKSYLTAITRPPAPSAPAARTKPSRPSGFFRRSLRQHPQQSSSKTTTASASTSGLSEYEDDHGADGADDDADDTSDGDGDHAPALHAQDDNETQATTTTTTTTSTTQFGKLDGLRSVLVPVMAFKGDSARRDALDYERFLDEITHPPSDAPPSPSRSRSPSMASHHYASDQSLRAFRMRRLKKIETDNVTLFNRIKHSTAHYRTQGFKKDWDQNVAYLTSICEFPVLRETVHPPPPRHARRRSPFTPRTTLEQLPSLLPPHGPTSEPPPTHHAIKALPTSPRRPRQLNLSPAFRSLRKGLPQAPALPPLTASPRATAKTSSTSAKSTTAIAGSRSLLAFVGNSHEDARDAEAADAACGSRSPSPPRRSSSAGLAVADDPSRYTLLKVGRFVGGKYLVLTVFCGDGITNAYGFDVVALDPATRVEFRLSITKEATHLLLDAVSSSTMAARTAAAAGTNLSMELIAQCVADHVQYACVGSSEAVFLVATAADPGGLGGDAIDTMEEDDEDPPRRPATQVSASDNTRVLVDTPYAALAFCFHQCVHIPSLGGDADDDSDGSNCVAHVFASTRPPPCCRASMHAQLQDGATVSPSTPVLLVEPSGDEYNGLVCYEVRGDATRPLPCGSVQLQVSVGDLLHQLELHHVAAEQHTRERLSLDRMIVLSLQFLHLSEASGTRQLELRIAAHNDWVAVTAVAGSPCRLALTVLPRSLETRRRSTSPRAKPRGVASNVESRLESGDGDDVKTVLQTGMLWRGAYLFARVALLTPSKADAAMGERWTDPLDERLVVNIFNASTGKYSERVLDGDAVEALSLKLGDWQAAVAAAHAPALVVFAKLLLLRMRLDVDLRNNEVIVFPALEPKYHNAGGNTSPTATARHHSPAKPLTTTVSTTTDADSLRDEPKQEGDTTVASAPRSSHSYSLDVELRQQIEAATAIQALGRGYLRRLQYQRQRQRPAGDTSVASAAQQSNTSFVGSLRPQQRVFVQQLAARRIQRACRSFAGRLAGRKNAHVELDGLVIKPLRTLTPSPRPSRGGSLLAHASQAVAASESVTQRGNKRAHGDGDEGDAAAGGGDDGDSEEEEEEEEDGDGDDDEEERSKHVDLLGSLPEEDGDDRGAAAARRASLMEQAPSCSSPAGGEASTQPPTTHGRAGRRARGGKFLLETTSPSPAEPQCWGIGERGRLLVGSPRYVIETHSE